MISQRVNKGIIPNSGLLGGLMVHYPSGPSCMDKVYRYSRVNSCLIINHAW